MRLNLFSRLPKLALCVLAAQSAISAADFKWSNVSMGGGGFVSSIVASPLEQNLFYARTDVGGAYRWDEATKSWTSLMDWVDVSERGLLGIEAIAVDPKTAGKVYMVAGTSYWNYGRTAFLRSSDKGATWETIYTWDSTGAKGSTVKSFKAHGNGMGRGNGEALAIDPNDPKIMFYGSKNKGLQKSTDNGTTWSKVAAFTTAAGSDTTWNGSGFSFVTFAPGSSTKLYAGFLRENNNVFQSTDGGATWSVVAIPAALFTTAGGAKVRLMPQRIAIPKDGSTLYVTFGDGAGPHTMAWDEGWGMIYDGYGRGAVLKYDVAGKTWTDISPEDMIDNGATAKSKFDSVNVAGAAANKNAYEYNAAYSGISINPNNPLELVVTTMGYTACQYWDAATAQWKGSWASNVSYSWDGGKTWIGFFQNSNPVHVGITDGGVGWLYGGSLHWAGTVTFDPFNAKRVWVTSGNGIFRSDDVTAFTYVPPENTWSGPTVTNNVVFAFAAQGIEETVPEEVVSIPGGPMISIIGDYDGFRHDDIRKFPAFRHQTAVSGSPVSLGSTRALAYAPKAGVLVKVADARSANPTTYNDVPISPVQYSKDSGTTWVVATYEAIAADLTQGSVAISADAAVTLWTPGKKAGASGAYPVKRYYNSAWTDVAGIDGAYVVGDPENAKVFYAYKQTDGFIYKSTDAGATFTKAGSAGVSNFKKFRVAPGREGDLWVPIGTEALAGGLKRSTNGGTSFTAIAGVTYCEAVGFGKSATVGGYPAVYIFGTVAGVTGVFQSDDQGATWVRVNDNEHEYGGLANGEFVQGDMNTYGVVYMSTAGRGIAARVPSDWAMNVSNSHATTAIQGQKPNLMPSLGASAAKVQNGYLELQVGQHPLNVSVYSLSGRRVFQKTFGASYRIPLQYLMPSQGMHVLRVQGAGKVMLAQTISLR